MRSKGGPPGHPLEQIPAGYVRKFGAVFPLPFKEEPIAGPPGREPTPEPWPEVLPGLNNEQIQELKKPKEDPRRAWALNLLSDEPPAHPEAVVVKNEFPEDRGENIDYNVLIERLLQKPQALYYDLDALIDQFGMMPIELWLQVPECHMLVLRLGKEDDRDRLKHYNQRMEACGIYIGAIQMPRLDGNLPDASTVGCVFVKEAAAALALRVSERMKAWATFQELAEQLLPSLYLESTVMIATDVDRATVDTLILYGRRIFIP